MIARSLKRWTMRTTTSNGVVASMGNGSRDRSMSTVPLHLSRANNGMVNVLVKSTKVPRPATIVPRKKKEKLTPFILEAPKEDMPDHISYAGNEKMPITSSLKIIGPNDDTPRGIWPVFRMMVRTGRLDILLTRLMISTSLACIVHWHVLY